MNMSASDATPVADAPSGHPAPTSPDPAPTSPDPAPTSPDPAPAGRPARRPRPIFLLVGIALALALALALFAGLGTRGGGTGTGTGTGMATGTSTALANGGTVRPPTGSKVPTFSLPRLGGGGKVGVPADGGGGGRPAILLFFASWCPSCQKEIPALARTYRLQQLGHSRLAAVSLIGVDGNDPTANALNFVHNSGVTFPVGADSVYAVTQGKFAIANLPESVFVEGNGTVVNVHYGALSPKSLVSWEKKLLAKD